MYIVPQVTTPDMILRMLAGWMHKWVSQCWILNKMLMRISLDLSRWTCCTYILPHLGKSLKVQPSRCGKPAVGLREEYKVWKQSWESRQMNVVAVVASQHLQQTLRSRAKSSLIDAAGFLYLKAKWTWNKYIQTTLVWRCVQTCSLATSTKTASWVRGIIGTPFQFFGFLILCSLLFLWVAGATWPTLGDLAGQNAVAAVLASVREIELLSSLRPVMDCFALRICWVSSFLGIVALLSESGMESTFQYWGHAMARWRKSFLAIQVVERLGKCLAAGERHEHLCHSQERDPHCGNSAREQDCVQRLSCRKTIRVFLDYRDWKAFSDVHTLRW